MAKAHFKRKKVFNFMIRYLCPIFAVIILFEFRGERIWMDFHVKQI